MSIQSMTGFARVQGNHAAFNWTWEVRSVNGKGLDLRTRLPQGFEGMVPQLRKIAATHFSRGNMQLSLQLESDEGSALPTVNKKALDLVVSQIEELRTKLDSPPPRAEAILALKGVLEVNDQLSNEDRAALETQLVKSFSSLCEELEANRTQEGNAIGSVLQGQLKQISDATQQIENDPSRTTSAIKARLADQVSQLLDTGTNLDIDRVHQEAAILATKADLREELDRLIAHVEAANQMFESGGAIGRKLDFLCQEFVRECNTICSKSNATSVTAVGLEMKVVIDQFREQVQNLE